MMKHYQTDLTTHDREAIDGHPGVPFLHWANESSTHIVLLIPASEYPAKGVKVKYLFGTADREHLANECVTMAQYFTRPNNNPERYTVHHFDGKRLKVVNGSYAVGVATAYRNNLLAMWNYKTHRADMACFA